MTSDCGDTSCANQTRVAVSRCYILNNNISLAPYVHVTVPLYTFPIVVHITSLVKLYLSSEFQYARGAMSMRQTIPSTYISERRHTLLACVTQPLIVI
jgi:hypothetical protein